MLTTEQAALAMGLSRRRVQQLAASGELMATKVGRDYMITREDVEVFLLMRTGMVVIGDPDVAEASEPESELLPV